MLSLCAVTNNTNERIMKVGDECTTKEFMKEALMLHSAEEGFELSVLKSDKNVYLDWTVLLCALNSKPFFCLQWVWILLAELFLCALLR